MVSGLTNTDLTYTALRRALHEIDHVEALESVLELDKERPS
jgi:hypothetical protein